MKKLYIFSLLLILCLCLYGCKTEEKTEVYNEIIQIEETVNNLQYEVDALNREVNYLSQIYNNLLNTYEGKYKTEDLYEWAHLCNRDGMRANFKVEVFHKKTFLGLTVSTKSYVVSGVLIQTNSNRNFIITTSYVLETIDGYSKKECKVTDAFNVEYDASIVTYSSQYNIGILEIQTKHDYLYKVPIAKSDPSTNSYVCNIFYNNSPINCMSFNKIEKYVSTDLNFNIAYNSCYVSDTCYGGMLLDEDAKLGGMIIYTYDNGKYVGSVTASIIRKFLSSNNIGC